MENCMCKNIRSRLSYARDFSIAVNKDRLRLVDGIPVIVATLRNQSQNDEDSSVLALLTALCSLVSENGATREVSSLCLYGTFFF